MVPLLRSLVAQGIENKAKYRRSWRRERLEMLIILPCLLLALSEAFPSLAESFWQILFGGSIPVISELFNGW